MKKYTGLKYLARAAMFLAITLVLPFLTGQIPTVGKMLCPMHLPVLLCGFFCGPLYGLFVGLVAPYLRFALFGAPTIMPTAIIMSGELMTYGLASGILFNVLPRRKLMTYVSLISSILLGKVTWTIMHVIFFYTINEPFSWQIFFMLGFVNSLPGIALQIILIPILVNYYYCRYNNDCYYKEKKRSKNNVRV